MSLNTETGVMTRVVVLCVFLLPFVLIALNESDLLGVTPLGRMPSSNVGYDKVVAFKGSMYAATWIPVIWGIPFVVGFLLRGDKPVNRME